MAGSHRAGLPLRNAAAAHSACMVRRTAAVVLSEAVRYLPFHCRTGRASLLFHQGPIACICGASGDFAAVVDCNHRELHLLQSADDSLVLFTLPGSNRRANSRDCVGGGLDVDHAQTFQLITTVNIVPNLPSPVA